MPLKIRNATPKDSKIIFNFIMELAIYEKAPNEVKTTAEEIEESLFSSNATAYALMTYMQDEYPNEIKKMGSELQESVNEIIKNIEELKKGK